MRPAAPDAYVKAPAVTGGRYDRTTILLHWLVAVLVIVQWVGAHAIDRFAKGAPKVDARSVHIVGGVLLLATLMVRIGWRLRRGDRMVPPASRAARIAVRTSHLGLYAVVATVLGLGVFLAWLRGDSMFGLFRIPAFEGHAYTAAGRHALANSVTDIHSLAANALLLLAGLHAAAALFHHVILRDDVLRRMVPHGLLR